MDEGTMAAYPTAKYQDERPASIAIELRQAVDALRSQVDALYEQLAPALRPHPTDPAEAVMEVLPRVSDLRNVLNDITAQTGLLVSLRERLEI